MIDAVLEFKLANNSWLLRKVQERKVLPYGLKEVLKLECDRQKGETYTQDQIEILNEEQSVIDNLPFDTCALRGDKIEKLYANESHVDKKKSVDVYTVIDDQIFLIECKYKAWPETKIVSSVESFQKEIVDKFKNSRTFMSKQSERLISRDCVVLLNRDSVEKVRSMFLRLRLEDDSSELFSEYQILDTEAFGSMYLSRS